MTNPPVNLIVFIGVHLVYPELVAWWVDVAYRVFECCYEEGAHVVEVRVVLWLVWVVWSKNSVQQTQNDNPNEHESGKVDNISAGWAYQLDEEAKVCIDFEVFKQFKGNA